MADLLRHYIHSNNIIYLRQKIMIFFPLSIFTYFSNVFFWSSLTAEINRFSFNHLVVFIFRRATSQLPLPPTPSPLLSDRRQRQPRHLRTLSECQHLSRRRHLSLKYDHNVNTFSVHFLICTSSSPFCSPLFTRP